MFAAPVSSKQCLQPQFHLNHVNSPSLIQTMFAAPVSSKRCLQPQFRRILSVTGRRGKWQDCKV
jgi:hypothetical protein